MFGRFSESSEVSHQTWIRVVRWRAHSAPKILMSSTSLTASQIESIKASQYAKNPYTGTMKNAMLPAIPVSAETAARFAALTQEQKRVVRMRVAIEVARLSKRRARRESATEFRAALATIGDQGRRRGLSLKKLKRMIDESR